jgi:hypothetical protein
MGGAAFTTISRHYVNYKDVWRSNDGAVWTEVTNNAPWGEREGFALLQRQGSIYLMGGVKSEANPGITLFNDIWTSPDSGATWTNPGLKVAPWSARAYFSMLLLNNDLLVLIGGSRAEKPLVLFNEVWIARFGNVSNGDVSYGNVSNGNVSYGNVSYGNVSNGDVSNGNVSALAKKTDVVGWELVKGVPPWGPRVNFAATIQVLYSLCIQVLYSLCIQVLYSLCILVLYSLCDCTHCVYWFCTHCVTVLTVYTGSVLTVYTGSVLTVYTYRYCTHCVYILVLYSLCDCTHCVYILVLY